MKDLKIFTDDIELQAKEQIELLLKQNAFKNCKIRIMPDVHYGIGCVIGFTGNLGEKVIPNIVGVDIGCGMLCVELGSADLDLAKIDKIINDNIPSGMSVRDEMTDIDISQLHCYDKLKNNSNRIEKSIGSLGGGNHFIEIDRDADDNKYLIIHSGSRNLGKQVADIYQHLAIEKNQFSSEKLPKDLCYLERADRQMYLDDMKFCQEFATKNRAKIAEIIIEKYYDQKLDFNNFETIHNYISFEDNIVRKGAISAKKGERVLIPMNMRDGCIIGVGKGNDDWNQSAPHGAGRIMSRKQTKQNFCLSEFQDLMSGIYTTSVNENTIDEMPFAYRQVDEILGRIKDTVVVEKIIKPVYNFKNHQEERKRGNEIQTT